MTSRDGGVKEKAEAACRTRCAIAIARSAMCIENRAAETPEVRNRIAGTSTEILHFFKLRASSVLGVSRLNTGGFFGLR